MPKNCSSSSRAARIFSSPEISFWPLLKLGAARRAAPFLNIDNRGQGRVRARNEKIETGRDRVMNKKARSEEHTSELQSLMRISYAVFCLKKKKEKRQQ